METISTTRVVNVRVSNIRPAYNNLNEWIADPANVYIGRGRVVFYNGGRYPAFDSVWANPFKVDAKMSRDESIRKYRQYLTDCLASGRITREQLRSLRGKTLGCWCKPEACHGDVLVEMCENE
jgi:hypothetical protein